MLYLGPNKKLNRVNVCQVKFGQMLFQQQPDESFLGMSCCHFGCHEIQCCSYSTGFDKTFEKVLICNPVLRHPLSYNLQIFFPYYWKKILYNWIISKRRFKYSRYNTLLVLVNPYILLESRIWILTIPVRSDLISQRQAGTLSWDQMGATKKYFNRGTKDFYICMLLLYIDWPGLYIYSLGNKTIIVCLVSCWP